MFRAALVAVAIAFAGIVPANADDTHPLDALWLGGFDDRHPGGVTVVVEDDKLVGLFVFDHYPPIEEDGTVGADGALRFHWDDGDGVLRPESDGTATLILHEQGQPDLTIPVERDE